MAYVGGRYVLCAYTGLAISVSTELLGRAELKLSVHATFFSVQSRLWPAAQTPSGIHNRLIWSKSATSTLSQPGFRWPTKVATPPCLSSVTFIAAGSRSGSNNQTFRSEKYSISLRFCSGEESLAHTMSEESMAAPLYTHSR